MWWFILSLCEDLKWLPHVQPVESFYVFPCKWAYHTNATVCQYAAQVKTVQSAIFRNIHTASMHGLLIPQQGCKKNSPEREVIRLYDVPSYTLWSLITKFNVWAGADAEVAVYLITLSDSFVVVCYSALYLTKVN